ncbi:MAG: Holliday junction resolvase RuvX [Bacteroidota bacterium]
MVGRILAIDYGQKRTGLAVSDPERKFAFPLDTVPTGKLYDYLKDYVATNQVTTFVVGDPRDLRNNPSSIAPQVESFVKKLKGLFPGFEVFRVDERFSSSMATRAIIDSGVSKKERREDKGMVDRVSATILLQSWITAEQMRQSQ